MVKRLRHRPFTAESGVRFPLRLPIEKTALLPRQHLWCAIRRGRLFFLYRDQTKSVKLLSRLLFSMFNSCSATRFGVYLDLVLFLLTALLPRQHLWCAIRRGRLFFLYRDQTKSVKLLSRLLFSMFNSCSATRFGVYLDLVLFLLTALLPRHHLWCVPSAGALVFL